MFEWIALLWYCEAFLCTFRPAFFAPSIAFLSGCSAPGDILLYLGLYLYCLYWIIAVYLKRYSAELDYGGTGNVGSRPF